MPPENNASNRNTERIAQQSICEDTVMVAADYSPLSTNSRTTVAQLLHELRVHEHDAEVVLSTDQLPSGIARICVSAGQDASSTAIVRYCRLSDPGEPTARRDEPLVIEPAVGIDGAFAAA